MTDADTIARRIAKRITGWCLEGEQEQEDDATEIIAAALRAEFSRGYEKATERQMKMRVRDAIEHGTGGGE